jgi:hypothetical protein
MLARDIAPNFNKTATDFTQETHSNMECSFVDLQHNASHQPNLEPDPIFLTYEPPFTVDMTQQNAENHVVHVRRAPSPDNFDVDCCKN